jgi:hypothetical protein
LNSELMIYFMKKTEFLNAGFLPPLQIIFMAARHPALNSTHCENSSA